MIKQQQQQAEKLSLQPEQIFKPSTTKKLVVKIVDDGISIKNLLQVLNTYQSNAIQEQNAKPAKDLEVSPEKQCLQNISNGTNIILKLQTVKKENLEQKLAQTMIRLELNEEPVLMDIEFTINYIALIFEVDLDKAALQQRFKAAPEDLKEFARKLPIVVEQDPNKQKDDLPNQNNANSPVQFLFYVQQQPASIKFKTKIVPTVFRLKIYVQKENLQQTESFANQEIVTDLNNID